MIPHTPRPVAIAGRLAENGARCRRFRREVLNQQVVLCGRPPYRHISMRSTVTEKGPDVDAVGMLQPAPVEPRQVAGRSSTERWQKPTTRLSILNLGTTD